MTFQVTQAFTDRVPELASLTGRAFADDPNADVALGDGAGRVTGRSMVPSRTDACRASWVSLGSRTRAGRCSCGFRRVTRSCTLQIDQEARRAAASLSDDEGVRSESYLDWIAEQLPPEPHWLLDHIAVPLRVRRRAKASAGALIEGFRDCRVSRSRHGPGLPRDGEAGERCDLQSASWFRVTLHDDASLPMDRTSVWFMRFEP